MVPAFRQLSKFIGRFTGRRSHETGGEADDASGDSAPPAPIPPPEAALVIPGHELLRSIGHGAYGEVWLARDEIGAYHAVKVIYKRTFADRNPFEREYRGILQYTPISRTHHGLVPILHVGRENEAGLFYYVMEVADCAHSGRNIDPATYCPRTLAYELDTRGRLPARECLQLGLELGEALRYLHSRQLIHRDIKPANIIFVNGMAKLADVGLVTHVAEARRDPKHLGTEGFTPPEGPGTLWADVYSLGKVLCETSMGHASVQNSLPPPDEKEQDELLPLNEIFFKACHDDLACRYQSVEELQHDLMRLYDQLYGGVPDARP
jgi:eukaryotic-like serine/threonine-protein kinase